MSHEIHHRETRVKVGRTHWDCTCGQGRWSTDLEQVAEHLKGHDIDGPHPIEPPHHNGEISFVSGVWDDGKIDPLV